MPGRCWAGLSATRSACLSEGRTPSEVAERWSGNRRDAARIIRERRCTDDTQMMIGVAESLVACGDFDGRDMAQCCVENCDRAHRCGPGNAQRRFRPPTGTITPALRRPEAPALNMPFLKRIQPKVFDLDLQESLEDAKGLIAWRWPERCTASVDASSQGCIMVRARIIGALIGEKVERIPHGR